MTLDFNGFIDSIAIQGVDGELFPEHIFDWKLQGVNCPTEDYTIGNTAEFIFTFDTDVEAQVGATVFVNLYGSGGEGHYSFGSFVFSITNVVKKKTLLNRYTITCSNAPTLNSLDAVIEKSDLSRLPANYTLRDLAIFARGGAEILNSENQTVNNNYIPSQNWWYQGLTYRQLLQWCYQLMGVNDAGYLGLETWRNLTWHGLFLPTSPNGCCLNFNATNTKSVDVANYNTPVIDKVWFGSEATDVGFTLGSGEQSMVFPSNPLVNPEDTSFLNPLYERVHSLQSYTPMKLELFHNYKTIDPTERKKVAPVYTLNRHEYDYTDFYNLIYPSPGVTRGLWDVYYQIWYDGEISDLNDQRNNYLKDAYEAHDLEALSITHIREYISAAKIGCFIRLYDGESTYAHGKNELILLDKDDNGFTVLWWGDWSWGDGDYLIRSFTWDSFIERYENDSYGNKYFKGIHWPNASGIPDIGGVPTTSALPRTGYYHTLTEPLKAYFYPDVNGGFEYGIIPAGSEIFVFYDSVWSGESSASTIAGALRLAGKQYKAISYLVPDGSDLPVPSPSRRRAALYYFDEETEAIIENQGDYNASFSIQQLAWNWVNDGTSYDAPVNEMATWMSYTGYTPSYTSTTYTGYANDSVGELPSLSFDIVGDMKNNFEAIALQNTNGGWLLEAHYDQRFDGYVYYNQSQSSISDTLRANLSVIITDNELDSVKQCQDSLGRFWNIHMNRESRTFVFDCLTRYVEHDGYTDVGNNPTPDTTYTGDFLDVTSFDVSMNADVLTSYTNNTYYCPIFNWEVTPSGVILEGSGSKDRRIENSYLSYDMRTTGKYYQINDSISGADSAIGQVDSQIASLNVRVGNAEAALSNKVESSDYNGNTIISKINANGVTETINASRVDLSNYVQNSDYKGSTIISKINSATSGIIDASKVDLSGYTPPAPSYSGDDIIAKVNANGVTSTINGNRLDLSSVVSTTNYNGDTIIDKINANGVTSTINGNRVNLTTTLASVAFSGSYNDLTDVPTTPIGQVQADWAQSTTTSVDYIKNKPTNLSDFTNDEGFVSITDIGDSAERNLDSAKTTYDNALWSFEIPADKHFMVDVFAYKPSLSNSVMPTSMALLNDSGATTPIGTQNVLKEVLATSMPSSDRISFTYLGCPSVTTTYYISLKTSSDGRVGYGYKGWYM